MARPSRPWFRFYVEANRDPKMRRLTPAQRWLWVAILSAARESCLPGFLMVSERTPYSWDDLADYAGMRLKDVEEGTDKMHDLGMIEFDALLGAWNVPAWQARQFESDDTTSRTRKHREGTTKERSKPVPGTDFGTPPETEAETETELSRSDLVISACRVLAERDLERAKRRPEGVRNERGLFESCLRSRERDHRSDLFKVAYANPDWTAQELANSVEPPVSLALPCCETCYQPLGETHDRDILCRNLRKADGA